MLNFILTLLGASVVGAAFSFRRGRRRCSNSRKSKSSSMSETSCLSLQEIVARCEGLWLLQELQMSFQGHRDALMRFQDMLDNGFGMKQSDLGQWLERVWKVQNGRNQQSWVPSPNVPATPSLTHAHTQLMEDRSSHGSSAAACALHMCRSVHACPSIKQTCEHHSATFHQASRNGCNSRADEEELINEPSTEEGSSDEENEAESHQCGNRSWQRYRRRRLSLPEDSVTQNHDSDKASYPHLLSKTLPPVPVMNKGLSRLIYRSISDSGLSPSSVSTLLAV